MSVHHRLLTAAVVALALSACGPVRDDPPPDVRRQYVPIPAELLKRGVMPVGPLSQSVEVAKKRRVLLEQCWGNLEKIEGLKPEDVKP